MAASFPSTASVGELHQLLPLSVIHRLPSLPLLLQHQAFWPRVTFSLGILPSSKQVRSPQAHASSSGAATHTSASLSLPGCSDQADLSYLPTHYLSWVTLPTPTVVKNTEDKASTSDFFSLFSYIVFLSSPFLHLTSTYSFLPFFLSFEVDEGENKSQETMRTIV